MMGTIEEIGQRQRRIVIEEVNPRIDNGRFPVKRIVGDEVVVQANIFTDGQDVLTCVLKFRPTGSKEWSETKMRMLGNDFWRGSFIVSKVGFYVFTIEAWIDRFRTWQRDLERKFTAGCLVDVELLYGATLLEEAARRASTEQADELVATAQAIKHDLIVSSPATMALALDQRMAVLMERYSDREQFTSYTQELSVAVDSVRAGFGAWYEMFPRSTAPEEGRHGTFRDCEEWVARIAEMGFDIVCFPPIHPIGAFAGDISSGGDFAPESARAGNPWAVGSREGGHKTVHPKLGTLEDFRSLVAKARQHGIEIALEMTFQCSRDHPYVREHPNWFRHRMIGSTQHMESLSKEYPNILLFDFETEDWSNLWKELKSIFEFWIEQGVTIFRVDNPQTKSFQFWEWCLGQIKEVHPEVIFLSKAFMRPRMMHYLAKIGFTESYCYFPWRNTKYELTEYLTALMQPSVREFLRVSLWPNTSDILPEYLQFGGRPAFVIRLILAATLGANYGIYGPPYEVFETVANEPGSEEYVHSEKLEIRFWKLGVANGLQDLMRKVNSIRQENSALQSNETLSFHLTSNDQIIAYSKRSKNDDNIILTVVNLDPHHTQCGWVGLDLKEWQIGARDSFQCHELLTGGRFIWSGSRNVVELNPRFLPAKIFRIQRPMRREYDFDHFI